LKNAIVYRCNPYNSYKVDVFVWRTCAKKTSANDKSSKNEGTFQKIPPVKQGAEKPGAGILAEKATPNRLINTRVYLLAAFATATFAFLLHFHSSSPVTLFYLCKENKLRLYPLPIIFISVAIVTQQACTNSNPIKQYALFFDINLFKA
jgi:hypothetical protein